MPTQKTETERQSDAQIDAYLAPLLALHDDQAIAIARILALKIYTLERGVEEILAHVRALSACAARNDRPKE